VKEKAAEGSGKAMRQSKLTRIPFTKCMSLREIEHKKDKKFTEREREREWKERGEGARNYISGFEGS
jgi:hypothetical protein